MGLRAMKGPALAFLFIIEFSFPACGQHLGTQDLVHTHASASGSETCAEDSCSTSKTVQGTALLQNSRDSAVVHESLTGYSAEIAKDAEEAEEETEEEEEGHGKGDGKGKKKRHGRGIKIGDGSKKRKAKGKKIGDGSK